MSLQPSGACPSCRSTSPFQLVPWRQPWLSEDACSLGCIACGQTGPVVPLLPAVEVSEALAIAAWDAWVAEFEATPRRPWPAADGVPLPPVGSGHA